MSELQRTSQFFAGAVGYASAAERSVRQNGLSTWANLATLFEAEMDRMVENSSTCSA